MRPRVALVVGLLAVVIAAVPGAQTPAPEERGAQGLAGMAKRLADMKPSPLDDLGPAPTWGSGPLPKPSLTEPFAIGAALYDEGRVPDAVVSLLAAMRIAIVPDTNAGARSAALILSESEVRTLVELGRRDLEDSEGIEDLPHSFSDLHAAVAEMLPDVSVEALASAYARAYEANRDSLFANILMGQPLEPETKLTRTQIWFLLMDGFAGAIAGGAPWGTADKEVPDLRSPNAQWTAEELREVLARLPLVSTSHLVTVAAPEFISQLPKAGPPIEVTLRAAAAAPPIVSRITGRTLLAGRAGSLAGQEVTWNVDEDSLLNEVGTVVSAVGAPVSAGAGGIARFVFQPGVNSAPGPANQIDEWASVGAHMNTAALTTNAYAVPQAFRRLVSGTTKIRVNVKVRWRPSEVLWVDVSNYFVRVSFNLPLVGGGTRTGIDKVLARLAKRSNGWFAGPGVAYQVSHLTVGAPNCQNDLSHSWQKMIVTAKPESGFGPARYSKDPAEALKYYIWALGDGTRGRSMALDPPRPGEYYSLRFYPTEEPRFLQADDCQPALPTERQPGIPWENRRLFAWNFIPLNDAQWTRPGQGYGVVLRPADLTVYYDDSSKDPLSESPVLGLIKRAFSLNGASVWEVQVARKQSLLREDLMEKAMVGIDIN
jgi:hypothetical protein